MAERVPETEPAVVVRNATLKAADWPGAKFNGNAKPDVVNSGEEVLSWVMLTGESPRLVMTAVWVVCWPTLTSGKVMLEGLICTAACGDALFVVLARPAQPLIAAALKITGPSSAMKFDFPRFPVTVTFPEVPL